MKALRRPVPFKEVAKTLGFTESKLRSLVDRKHFPSPIKLGSRKYYFEDRIANFFEDKEAETFEVSYAKVNSRQKRARVISPSRVRNILSEEIDSWERKNRHIAQNYQPQRSKRTGGSGVVELSAFRGRKGREKSK